jgi:hypothetical protein
MFTTTPAFTERQASCKSLMAQQPIAFAEPHERGVFVTKSKPDFSFDVKRPAGEASNMSDKWFDSTFAPLPGVGNSPTA